MKFGDVSVADAIGSVLAHSIDCAGKRLRKGVFLDQSHIDDLVAADVKTVTVATLEAGDVHEDQAAEQLAHAICPDLGRANLRRSVAFTGRVNLIAERAGIVRLDKDRLIAMNAVDPMITIATVPDFQQMQSGGLVGTVKIISYAVTQSDLDRACDIARASVRLATPVMRSADLIVTQAVGLSPDKGVDAIRARLEALDMSLANVVTVPHMIEDLSRAIATRTSDMTLILTGSATSDCYDVAPMALTQAGGNLLRFGMPVDPGNLLFHGELAGRPVIGLPGCARSPALNGADWVLSRLACGHVLSDQDFANMSVGGLLKEIPTRPLPRRSRKGS